MAYIVMAYIVMAYIAMAYIVMAQRDSSEPWGTAHIVSVTKCIGLHLRSGVFL